MLPENASATISDPTIRSAFATIDKDWLVQDEKVVAVSGNILIEPLHSIPILPGRRILAETQGVHPEVLPSLRSALPGRRPSPAQSFDELVHFDGFLGRNLWHFFDDALNPLLMMRAEGLLPAGAPILVHRQIWDLPIARLFLGQSELAGLPWVVQDGQWIGARRVIKGLRNIQYFGAAHRLARSLVGSGSGRRRIFLNRRTRYGRNLSNLGEVEAVTRRFGFETVYPEDLPFERQVELFADTGAIVGIHGAGLTNLLFSDVERLGCIELHSDGYLMPHYYWMLKLLGVRHYDAVLGTAMDWRQAFTVDAAELERRIEEMLERLG